ncbi:hypothetical protein JX266_008884 [Neoarthrinium moseri]|nr:hypothetical protein JX266_008884 [Neoarthrinium moseri]
MEPYTGDVPGTHHAILHQDGGHAQREAPKYGPELPEICWLEAKSGGKSIPRAEIAAPDDAVRSLLSDAKHELKHTRYFLRSSVSSSSAPQSTRATKRNRPKKQAIVIELKPIRDVKNRVSKKKGKDKEHESRRVRILAGLAKSQLERTSNDACEAGSIDKPDVEASCYPRIKVNDLVGAAEHAARLMNPEYSSSVPRLVFWADGSWKSVNYPLSGAGVAYKRYLEPESPWIFNAYGMYGLCSPKDAELFAIERALRIAFQEAQLCCRPAAEGDHSGEELFPTVFVLTDSQPSLRGIDEGTRGAKRPSCLVNSILDGMQQLGKLGVLVELHWVPGHTNVEHLLGNKYADQLALLGRQCVLEWQPEMAYEHRGKFLEAFRTPVPFGLQLDTGAVRIKQTKRMISSNGLPLSQEISLPKQLVSSRIVEPENLGPCLIGADLGGEPIYHRRPGLDVNDSVTDDELEIVM